jgi:hypothetical protein
MAKKEKEGPSLRDFGETWEISGNNNHATDSVPDISGNNLFCPTQVCDAFGSELTVFPGPAAHGFRLIHQDHGNTISDHGF